MRYSHVARGRGIEVATVKQAFGRGRVIDAARARSVGMIDRIGSFEEALGIASDAKQHGPVSLSPSAPTRAVSFTEMTASQRRQRLEELERG